MPAARLTRTCAHDALCCAACGRLLRDDLCWISPGCLFYTYCERRTADPTHPGRSRRCGQHNVLLAGDTVVRAVAITRDEFRRLTDRSDPRHPRTPAAAAALLGITPPD